MNASPSARDLPAPRNDAELAEVYGPYINRLALARGVRPQDVDDFTQDILMAYVEAGFVKYYWDNDGPARGPFSTWLRGYVVKKAFSFVRGARSPWLSLDFTDASQEGAIDEAWLAVSDPLVEWVVQRSELAAFMDWLEASDPQLHALAWHVFMEALEHEEVNRFRVAEALGVSRKQVDLLMAVLREAATHWGFFR